jgi:hypothetical protein
VAFAHSEGTEPGDPSSASAVLEFGAATERYTRLAIERKSWRQPRPAPAASPPVPSAPVDHAAHDAHAGHSMPMPAEVDVRKPAADAHANH